MPSWFASLMGHVINWISGYCIENYSYVRDCTSLVSCNVIGNSFSCHLRMCYSCYWYLPMMATGPRPMAKMHVGAFLNAYCPWSFQHRKLRHCSYNYMTLLKLQHILNVLLDRGVHGFLLHVHVSISLSACKKWVILLGGWSMNWFPQCIMYRLW